MTFTRVYTAEAISSRSNIDSFGVDLHHAIMQPQVVLQWQKDILPRRIRWAQTQVWENVYLKYLK